VGIATNQIEAAPGEHGVSVGQTHRMLAMQAFAIDEPVPARVVVVGLAEDFDAATQPPRQRGVVVVPGGYELPLRKADSRLIFSPSVRKRLPTLMTTTLGWSSAAPVPGSR
jgi:hypothetical protein